MGPFALNIHRGRRREMAPLWTRHITTNPSRLGTERFATTYRMWTGWVPSVITQSFLFRDDPTICEISSSWCALPAIQDRTINAMDLNNDTSWQFLPRKISWQPYITEYLLINGEGRIYERFCVQWHKVTWCWAGESSTGMARVLPTRLGSSDRPSGAKGPKGIP